MNPRDSHSSWIRVLLGRAAAGTHRRDRLQIAIVVNQLATPGLGSWLAGHRRAGAGQLTLALAGFILIVGFLGLFILRMLLALLSGTDPVAPPSAWWRYGLVLFVSAWMWSGLTSLQLWKELRSLPRRGAASPPAMPEP